MEAEKSYDLPSASWRTRKAKGAIWFESKGLRVGWREWGNGVGKSRSESER